MIKLNFGTRCFPLNEGEAVFVAESLLAAVSGKKTVQPSFTSGMHGSISIRKDSRSPAENKEQGGNVNFRSNPQQSDHVLTDC